jgi:hypothetical protein
MAFLSHLDPKIEATEIKDALDTGSIALLNLRGKPTKDGYDVGAYSDVLLKQIEESGYDKAVISAVPLAISVQNRLASPSSDNQAEMQTYRDYVPADNETRQAHEAVDDAALKQVIQSELIKKNQGQPSSEQVEQIAHIAKTIVAVYSDIENAASKDDVAATYGMEKSMDGAISATLDHLKQTTVNRYQSNQRQLSATFDR